MKAHASVVAGVEVGDDLKLRVKLIQIVDGDPGLTGDFVFKWFTSVGNTIQEARENCLLSIAFFIRCRPDLRDSILKALEPEAARGVREQMGLASEEEETTRSRR